MKKLILIFIVFLVIQASSYAQYSPKDKFYVGWEVGVPSNDFISATSFRGGRVAYERMVKPHLSVGLGMSWNSFEQYVPKTTYQKSDGSGAITSDIVRELYSLPLTLDVKYYLRPGDKLQPYVGIGLGGQYSAQAIYFNIWGIEDNNWGFVARPELGLSYAFNHNLGLNLNAAYNSASIKSDFFKTSNVDHIALGIGLVFSQ